MKSRKIFLLFIAEKNLVTFQIFYDIFLTISEPDFSLEKFCSVESSSESMFSQRGTEKRKNITEVNVLKVKSYLFVCLLILCVFSTSFAAPVPIEEIAKKIRKDDSPGRFYSKYPDIQVLVEFGIASWYDCPLKPEKVSNPKYQVKDHIFPVAHKTLPFGTLIKVINPQNGKKILARVVDRGPFIAGRIIDLDRHASEALEISGIGKIILKIYKATPNQFASAKK